VRNRVTEARLSENAYSGAFFTQLSSASADKRDMRTERTDELTIQHLPTTNPPPSSADEQVDAALTALGLVSGETTPTSRRQALSELQQREGLPQTGRLDDATSAVLPDALRRHESMLRNAAAAGQGAPLRDAGAEMAQEASLAMMRFGELSGDEQATRIQVPTHPSSARLLGRNLRARTPASLVDRARRLQATLDQVHAEDGGHADSAVRTTRRAALTSLVALYDEMDRRVMQAPVDATGLPQLEGVTWPAGSPLAGAVMDIEPFGQRDMWTAELARLPQPRRHAPRPRDHASERRSPQAGAVRAGRNPGPVTLRPPILDVTEAEAQLRESEGGFLPEGSGVASEVGSHVTVKLLEFVGAESAAFVGKALGPIIGGITNSLDLINGWVASDNNVEAAGRTFGAEFGLQVAIFDSPRLRASIRDGHMSQRELTAMVHANFATQRAWSRSIRFGGLALSGVATRSMNEGIGIAARLINQALEQATEQLDQHGVTDPAQREDALTRAATRGAEAGLHLLHEHNDHIRTRIRETA